MEFKEILDLAIAEPGVTAVCMDGHRMQGFSMRECWSHALEEAPWSQHERKDWTLGVKWAWKFEFHELVLFNYSYAALMESTYLLMLLILRVR
jgi:hypothetical protein